MLSTDMQSDVRDDDAWPQPSLITSIDGLLRIPNLTDTTRVLNKNEHFCQIREVFVPHIAENKTKPRVALKRHLLDQYDNYYYSPDGVQKSVKPELSYKSYGGARRVGHIQTSMGCVRVRVRSRPRRLVITTFPMRRRRIGR